MAGTFEDRTDVLLAMTGAGELEGTVIVDQIYARWQHESLNFAHPRGGQALYLQEPLMTHFAEYLEGYAKTVLIDGGEDAVRDAMEHLAGEVAVKAPVEFGNLRASGHPVVTSDGHVTYDREPLQHRLTEEEIRAERGEFGPPSVAREHEAAWLAAHPGEPGPARSPQSHARMMRWLGAQGLA